VGVLLGRNGLGGLKGKMEMNLYITQRFSMQLFALAFCIVVFSGFSKPASAAVQEIIAVVNEDAISARDFNKRMKLIIISSGLPNNKDIRQRVSPQVLGSLIDEKIMVQEAHGMNMKVTRAEIDAGFAKIAAQNNMAADKFKAQLKRGGIDITTMYDQIEAQVAWSKVVQARLRPKVIISDRDVDAELERIKAKIGTKEYLAAEILLPVNDDKDEKRVKQFAASLVKEVKSGKASFFKLAQQFSKSAGANNGGDKGWLNEAQISTEILKALRSIKKNQVSSPVKTLNGYHILFLRNTRMVSEETMPSRDQIYYNIGAQRIEKLQRRYLQDLKAAAFIDVRA